MRKSLKFYVTIFSPSWSTKKPGTEALRIWVAGCATGEEAYSIAMCLQEQLGDRAAAIRIQIFATDISEIAIAKARTGLYRQNELTGVSPSRLQQFFIKQDGSYQSTKIIRICVFSHHKPAERSAILKDRPGLLPQRAHLPEPVLQKNL